MPPVTCCAAPAGAADEPGEARAWIVLTSDGQAVTRSIDSDAEEVLEEEAAAHGARDAACSMHRLWCSSTGALLLPVLFKQSIDFR